MKIRAKFKCNGVTLHEGGSETVTMVPVYGNGEANKEWSKYTPAGNLSMTITAAGAVGQFKPGVEYFLDFTPADE